MDQYVNDDESSSPQPGKPKRQMRRATPYLSFLNIETKKNLLKRIGFLTFGGEDGNRTRLNGFAGRCITSLLPRQKEWYRSHARRYSATSTKREARLPFGYSGAGEEARTLDLNLGKVALYQLSYSRYVLHVYYANDYLLLRAADLLFASLGDWSGRRGSNSRPQPWQGCALPTELLPLCKNKIIAETN
jgi:hypothetical protein